MMFSITYFSFATHAFGTGELRDLLTVSRKNNARLAVTGMLLYRDGNFMQVLEGRSPSVDLLYMRIASDPRHDQLKSIVRERIRRRTFPDWSMGFQDLGSAEARSAPGFSEFLNTPLTFAAFDGQVGRSRKLLALFKRRL